MHLWLILISFQTHAIFFYSQNTKDAMQNVLMLLCIKEKMHLEATYLNMNEMQMRFSANNDSNFSQSVP